MTGTMSTPTDSPAQTSPRPRRVATPSWLDLRLVIGVILVAASVAIGAVVVSRAGNTHPVVTATRSLAAGTLLRAADLRITQVQLPGDGAGIYVLRVEDAVGRTLDRPVSRGEIVPAAAVRPAAAGTTVELPLAAGAAPALHKGQRIEIWLSTKTCASVVLLPDVVVQDVHADTSNSFGGGSGGQDVQISVAQDLASRVVAAIGIDQAQIRAGILAGTPTRAPSRPPVDAGPGGLPSDLGACVSPSPSGS